MKTIALKNLTISGWCTCENKEISVTIKLGGNNYFEDDKGRNRLRQVVFEKDFKKMMHKHILRIANELERLPHPGTKQKTCHLD